MEHRYSVRKPFEFRVLLYRHGLPVQSGMSRDLGMGGVFIEADDWQWHRNEPLEVEFLAADGSAAMRVTVVVIHLRDAGAGLMFDALTAEQRGQLRAWLLQRDYEAPRETERKLAVA